MATIFTANSSTVTANGQPVEGVQSIDYRLERDHSNVYALGSAERLTSYYAPRGSRPWSEWLQPRQTSISSPTAARASSSSRRLPMARA